MIAIPISSKYVPLLSIIIIQNRNSESFSAGNFAVKNLDHTIFSPGSLFLVGTQRGKCIVFMCDCGLPRNLPKRDRRILCCGIGWLTTAAIIFAVAIVLYFTLPGLYHDLVVQNSVITGKVQFNYKDIFNCACLKKSIESS